HFSKLFLILKSGVNHTSRGSISTSTLPSIKLRKCSSKIITSILSFISGRLATKSNQIKQLIRNGRSPRLQRTFKKSITSFRHSTYTTLFRSCILVSNIRFSNPASTIPAEEASAPARSQALSSGNAAARQSRVSFPLSAADLPPSPTKSSNLSETAEVPACNVPSRSPLPALAIAPETKLGTASSGLGTLEP